MNRDIGSAILAVVLTSAVSFRADAKDIEVKSAIGSVIVHPDAATVTRQAEVELPAGASTLVFKNLPFSVDPASLRVSGEGNARIMIGSVETRVESAETKKVDNAVEARLKVLRGELDAVQTAIESLGVKQAMIGRFAQSGPEKLSPESRPLPPAEWGAAFETVGAALSKTGEELRAAKAKARDLEEEIRALEAGVGRPLGRGPAREALVSIEAPSASRARLSLTYLVGGAGWTPAYDARLETGDANKKPALEFVRRAQVTQRTGEDWTDVALSVSTVRARRAAAAPEVVPLRLAFLDYPVPMAKSVGSAMRRENRSMDAAAPAPAAPARVEEKEADAAPEPVQQQTAALDAGAFQATFKVAGTVSAPGDGAMKSFVLSSRRLEPKLEIRTAPALDPTAFLEARIVNDEEAPLTPGPLNVHRDGVFVGASRIALVAPGDAANFGFGADEKVKVTRAPVKRMENEPGWFGQTKTEMRDFKTTVKNLHGFPVHVTIVDQIPFSESTAITVETLPQMTPPTEKQVDEKRGVLAWSFDVQPSETKDIRLAWKVKWPADRDIVTQPAR